MTFEHLSVYTSNMQSLRELGFEVRLNLYIQTMRKLSARLALPEEQQATLAHIEEILLTQARAQSISTMLEADPSFHADLQYAEATLSVFQQAPVPGEEECP